MVQVHCTPWALALKWCRSSAFLVALLWPLDAICMHIMEYSGILKWVGGKRYRDDKVLSYLVWLVFGDSIPT